MAENPEEEPKKGVELSLGEPSVVVDRVHQIYRTETTDPSTMSMAPS